jgi:hypothetical protein
MSPFLPPHQVYDFGPAHSPPVQIAEEDEDCSFFTAPPSPLPTFIYVEEEEEMQAGQEDACHAAGQNKQDENVPKDKTQIQPQSRSFSLRKRGTAEARRSISITISRKQHKQDTLPSISTSKSSNNTITLDRFSACIPCRKRKIKCIPKGDSHHYLSNGTNNGVCATCIRRKKDCFWPKIDLSSAVRGPSASPSQAEAPPTSAKDDVEQMQCCEEEKEEESVKKCEEVKDEKEEVTSPVKIKQEEDVEALPIETPIRASTFDDTYFSVPGQGFGRIISTPGLSSSSSSSSSSPIISPRTDASFLSPTLTESFFFEDKADCQSPPPLVYLDNLHHSLQPDMQFADDQYSH